MTNAAFIRLLVLSAAVAWTVFTGMKAAETPLWPSAFFGSFAGLIALFYLTDWLPLTKEAPKTDRQRITLEINGERYGASDD